MTWEQSVASCNTDTFEKLSFEQAIALCGDHNCDHSYDDETWHCTEIGVLLLTYSQEGNPMRVQLCGTQLAKWA